MTERLKGCVVTFERCTTDDEVKVILDAINAIRFVASVTDSIVDPVDALNRSRIMEKVEQRIYAGLEKVFNDLKRGR